MDKVDQLIREVNEAQMAVWEAQAKGDRYAEATATGRLKRAQEALTRASQS